MSEYTPPSGPGMGSPIPPPMQQPPLGAVPPDVSGKKIAAGICGILLGSLGIHKFILGYTGAGIIMLVASLLCIGQPIMWVIGLIEGIIYLTKSDQEFYGTYMRQQKQWF